MTGNYLAADEHRLDGLDGLLVQFISVYLCSSAAEYL